MDMNLLLGYWGATNRTYHHTAPTNSLFALHEALLLIKEEGLEQSLGAPPPPPRRAQGRASRRWASSSSWPSPTSCRR